jgi:hypothetical protein
MFEARSVIMYHEWGNQLPLVIKWIAITIFIVVILDMVWLYWKGTRRPKI